MNKLDLLAPDWGRIPPVRATGPARRTGDGRIELDTTAGPLTLSLHPFGLRLRFGPDRDNAYGILAADPPEDSIWLKTDDGHTVVDSPGFVLHVEHDTLAFTLAADDRTVQRSPTDGHFVRRFRIPPFAKLDQGWFMALHLGSGEPVYGLGEKWGRLDKRGQFIHSYNHDALGVSAERSYKNAPFAWSPMGWGLFVHTPAPVVHGVGFAPWSQRAYGLMVEDDSLDVFLIAGQDGAEILERYTGLTGRAPMPPLWSLGVILSKAYYKDADELLATARAVRDRNMPCDVITLDGRAWQDTDTRFAFEWDAQRYPDPAKVMAELKALDFKVCLWEYPLVSVHNPLFGRMAQDGWLLTDGRTGEPYRFAWEREPFDNVLTPLPDSGLVDFTHPDAYAFWRDSHKALFDLGVDMIKADFGEQVQPDMLAHNGETGHALHNVYALLYNRCVWEAADQHCASGPFLFSRSAWSSSQRYPSQWGGDPQADWEGLAGSLRGGLSWGLTGAPYYATDVGGFYGDQRDPALYVRWAQAGVFSAHMRLHGIGQREPWSYGPAAEQAAMAALKLRYRLIPYLRQTMTEAHARGMPVQRAMPLAYPEEREAWAFDDQFMFGDDMLVAPCLRPDGLVQVYLPQGHWRRFPDGEAFEGGRTHKLTLKLDEMAVFVHEGAEIPLGPAVRHTGELDGAVRIEERWRAG